jgi:transposase-like protein
MATKRYAQNPALKKSPVIDALAKASADEAAARAFIEEWRWNGKPVCPHCGAEDTYRMTGESAERRGLHRCRGCKKQFTVRVGTIFEDSALPLHKWCRAIWEATKAKNGVSALELARTLQITHKSALFMLNRLRWAMAQGPDTPKLDGDVECDETFIGPRRPRIRGKKKGRRPGQPKQPVAACIERDGRVRTRLIPSVTSANVRGFLQDSVEPGSWLYTDEEKVYTIVGREFSGHCTVNHGRREYVRGDASTNAIENFFSRVKRSLTGTYHGVSREHLHRYMAQFEFAHNTRDLNDGQRVVELVKRIEGKRLTYRVCKDGEAAA